MKMSNFCYLIILTVILPVRFIFPQDSSKIIILSGKVGATIDRQERDYFGLFKNFNSFDNAVFYQATNGNYYCKVTFGKNGELKDSVYQVQYGQLINTAIKINYFEDLKQGRTDIDLSGIRIYFASGEEIKNNKTPLINRLEHYSLLNELPLSTTKIDFRNLIKQKWQYGISVGMGYNSVDFDGLGKIFNILEEIIPQEFSSHILS